MSGKKNLGEAAARLSLVAQFDDLCRNRVRIMEDVDKQHGESLKIIDALRNQCRARKANEGEAKQLRQSLKNEKERNDVLAVQMKHLRSLVDAESEKRKKAEEKKSYLEEQISLIREVVEKDHSTLNPEMKKKLVHLSCTALASPQMMDPTITWHQGDESLQNFLLPSEVSFDDTVLDDNKSSKTNILKRPLMTAISESRTDGSPEPRKRSYEDISDDESDSTSNAQDASSTPTGRPRRYRKVCRMNRCSAMVKTRMREKLNSALSPQQSGSDSTVNSGGLRGNRNHSFGHKLVIRSAVCLPCGGRIKPCRQALRCLHCRALAHKYCKEKMAMPCIPVPDSSPVKGFLADYCPPTSPKVPALLYHCLLEIEKRGLDEVGLYMVSAGEKEVKELAKKFLFGENLPSLANIDIHIVSGTVKWFLRSLVEPLVTVEHRSKFLDAAERPGFENSFRACNEVVQQLPLSNRQTLAYFILHLHRVAKSRSCKMPLENLAKVFGPIIVDYPSSTDISSAAATKKELKIMTLLLTIPAEFWKNQLSRSYDSRFGATRGRDRLDEHRQGSAASGSSPVPTRNYGMLMEIPYPLFADVLEVEDVSCLDEYLAGLAADDTVPMALIEYIDDAELRERVRSRFQLERIPKKYRKRIVELYPETANFYGTPV